MKNDESIRLSPYRFIKYVQENIVVPKSQLCSSKTLLDRNIKRNILFYAFSLKRIIRLILQIKTRKPT